VKNNAAWSVKPIVRHTTNYFLQRETLMSQYELFAQKDLKNLSKRNSTIKDHTHPNETLKFWSATLDKEFGNPKNYDRPYASFGYRTPYPSTPRSERQNNG